MRDDGTARGAEGMLHLLVCAVPTHFSNIISNFVVFQILFQTLTGAAPGLVERMVRFSVAFYRYFFVTRIVEKLIVPNSTFCYPGGSNGRKLALTVLPRRCKGSVVLAGALKAIDFSRAAVARTFWGLDLEISC